MTLSSNPQYVIALDIGGTKIRGGIITKDGAIVRTVTLPTDISDDRTSILASVEAALADLFENGGVNVACIGVSTAGVVDRATGSIVNATPNLPGWEGMLLASHLRARWGVPVTVENDGKSALFAELSHCPHLSCGTAVLLTLGTGLGGAIAIDGKILRGATHVAGHFGLSQGGALTDGAIMPREYYVSGAGLARLMPHRAGSTHSTSRGVLAAVEAGDPDAMTARDMWVAEIAKTITDVRWMIDPQWLILGGGILDARDLWWADLEQQLIQAGTPLRPTPASCGSDAAMLGAAHIAFSIAEFSA
jgi:glucokinase